MVINFSQDTDPGNCFSRWCSQQISHQVQLMDNILARKKRFSSQKLCKYAPNAPYIYCWCILKTEQKLQLAITVTFLTNILSESLIAKHKKFSTFTIKSVSDEHKVIQAEFVPNVLELGQITEQRCIFLQIIMFQNH